MKKYKILAILTTLVILATFTFPVNADTPQSQGRTQESEVVEWDGESTLIEGNTYLISKTVYVKGNLIVPNDVKIRVEWNSELIFTKESTVNLYGEIRVASGAELFVSGVFNVRQGGTLDVGGDLNCSLSSCVSVGGTLTVRYGGELKTSGVFNLTKKAVLNNHDTVMFLKSSKGTFSGKVVNAESSFFRIAGDVGISVSGNAVNFGEILVANVGTFTNSGVITLEKKSRFYRVGRFVNTKSGRLFDNSGVDRYLLSPQAIDNEEETIIYGMDISRWNGDIDWESVGKSGLDFVMMRIGVGAYTDKSGTFHENAMDSKYKEYVKGAQENGLEVGVYWYSYAKTVADMEQEAVFLLGLLSNYKLTYPVALDMEEQRGYYTDDPSDMADAFLNIISDAGYFPMLYSYKNWLESYITVDVREKYAVWVAHIDVSATSYKNPYYMWQYSWTGRVSGMNGNVDMNIAYRDFADYIRRHELNKL
ncbi:MAG: glycoside hydrolase family 25 protein [Oscillospiraceae bacterium]|nr:glycoside hydrolase family 25 protein [Oscillospiraceae bacterium]